MKNDDYDQVILVDTDEVDGINDNKIIEVIDHRKIHNVDRLKNLKRKQIELVGACATLIAEKFYKGKIEPSQESAALLYSAIVSNTINFQGRVTTVRDRAMFQWLEGFIDIDNNYIEEMFKAKSNLGDRSLKEVKKEGNYNYIFFTIIDVVEEFNKIITVDQDSQKLVKETLNLEFKNNIATTQSVQMRKEIIPKVKEYIEDKN